VKIGRLINPALAGSQWLDADGDTVEETGEVLLRKL
jgi:hypothetical protein